MSGGQVNGSTLGITFAILMGFVIGKDAESRGMSGRKWGIASSLFMIVAVPVYLSIRKSKKTDLSYTRQEILIGISVFTVGLIGLFVILYNHLFMPYHCGELELIDIKIPILISIGITYIFGFLAFLKKDWGLLAVGMSSFLFLLIFQLMFISSGYKVEENEYIVHKDKIKITEGYIKVGRFKQKEIGVRGIVDREYSSIAVKSRDKISKSEKTGLYYKGWSLAPFTGIKVSVNQEKSAIEGACFFENGVKEKCKKFMEQGKIKTVKYFSNGQILSKKIEKNGKLRGEYVEYHSNGQLERKIVPYKGELTGEVWYRRANGGREKRFNIKQGKLIQYHENGKLNVKLRYEDDKCLPRKYYNKQGELIQKAKDLPLSDKKKFKGKKEKYKRTKVVSYHEGQISYIAKAVWHKSYKYRLYDLKYRQGYYFDYDSDWQTIESRSYTKTGDKKGIWLEVEGAGEIKTEFYPVNGKNIKFEGQEKNGKKIGTWEYYYPDGGLAAREVYKAPGILEKGKYHWKDKAEIKVIADKNGKAKKAIMKFNSEKTQTIDLTDDS